MSLLRVTAHLDGPIATRQPVQLDAVLMQAHPYLSGKAVTRATPEADLEEPSISVHRLYHGGTRVFLCSGWHFPATARRGVEHIVKRKDGLDLDDLEHPWNPALGPGKNRCVPMPLLLTPTVWWFAIGRREGVKKLLRRVHQLGGLRAHGYGRVRSWEIDAIADATLDSVLVTADGKAARHLPAAWAIDPPATDAGSWLPPYWHPCRIGHRVPEGNRCNLAPAVLGRVAECR